MNIYKVCFSSMTAYYSPRFIEAEDEFEAKRIFANGAFSESEIRMMTVRKASLKEAQKTEDECQN